MEDNSLFINTTDALRIIEEEAPAPVTLVTLIAWCKKYGLGFKLGGRWWVNELKLRAFIKLEG